MKQIKFNQIQLTLISALFDGLAFLIIYLVLTNSSLSSHFYGLGSFGLVNYIIFALVYFILRYRSIPPVLPKLWADLAASIGYLVLSIPFVLGLEFIYAGNFNASHSTIINAISLIFYGIIWSKLIFHILQSSLFSLSRAKRKVLLVGSNRSINSVIDIFNSPRDGSEVIGILDNVIRKGEIINGVPALGKINTIEEVLNDNQIDMIVQVSGSENTTLLLTLAEHRRIRFMVAPKMFGLLNKSISSIYYGNQLFLEPKGTALSGWAQVFKRLIDIILSLFFLLLLSPVFLLIGIVTKIIYPKQNIFVNQKRVDGRSGREFKMWRFNSLPNNIKEPIPTKLNYKEFHGVNQKKLVGLNKFMRFMRRTHLIDLPQLYNVLVGDMGIIGPRPPFKVEYDNYDWLDRKRLLIKPGITGMWQIDSRKNDFDAMVQSDKFYVENWSFGLDIKIFFLTIYKFIFGRLA